MIVSHQVANASKYFDWTHMCKLFTYILRDDQHFREMVQGQSRAFLVRDEPHDNVTDLWSAFCQSPCMDLIALATVKHFEKLNKHGHATPKYMEWRTHYVERVRVLSDQSVSPTILTSFSFSPVPFTLRPLKEESGEYPI